MMLQQTMDINWKDWLELDVPPLILLSVLVVFKLIEIFKKNGGRR